MGHDDYDYDRNYTNLFAVQFVAEVGVEFEVEHYHGYGMREGPAVRVDNDRELVDVIRLTTMPVKWDTLGMGYIVYPDVNDAGE
jgi:hypothetical protein